MTNRNDSILAPFEDDDRTTSTPISRAPLGGSRQVLTPLQSIDFDDPNIGTVSKHFLTIDDTVTAERSTQTEKRDKQTTSVSFADRRPTETMSREPTDMS